MQPRHKRQRGQQPFGAVARDAMPANAFLIFDLELISSASPAPVETPTP